MYKACYVMLHIILNISCFVEKHLKFGGGTTRGNKKIAIKRKEGISHLTMHLLKTSYTYKPV